MRTSLRSLLARSTSRGKCLGCAMPAEVTATQLQSQTSVLQGGGWKHQNVSTGSIASSGAADVTLTWTAAFADANYDPICNVIGSQASNSDLRLHHIESISSTAVVARVINDDSSTAHPARWSAPRCINKFCEWMSAVREGKRRWLAIPVAKPPSCFWSSFRSI